MESQKAETATPKPRIRRSVSQPGLDGKASAEARRRQGQKRQPLADEAATQRFLKDLLCSKSVEEEHNLAEVAESNLGGSATASGAVASSVRIQDTPQADSMPVATLPPPPKDPLEIETERREFISQVCGEQSRPEVREWIGKVYLMTQKSQSAQAAAARDVKEKRRRRVRSSSAGSESGFSGQTGYTGITGVTGTTATALQTVGGSIVARPKSVESDESLVVHHSKGDEPLSMKERIQSYLENRIPELAEHIEATVSEKVQELQKEVDGEVAEQFLRTASSHKVFDGKANYLRWQNARQQALQKRLDAKMAKWILEAIETWDQQKVTEKKEKEVSETDLIFDYLTKRAAHIDSGKLPSNIPIFKSFKASYSVPRMWRDKFIGNA
eukprot:TRINITY_DN9438_c3_g1_i1.p1 TRINITY_DN9438_c3_g1~~TRINITY_DN9438_c3_g1_i1.p1  ORF type:complete len:385 (-),score=95.93 TRINITY_DN9438_c3_g1_i1:103-1257(-)